MFPMKYAYGNQKIYKHKQNEQNQHSKTKQTYDLPLRFVYTLLNKCEKLLDETTDILFLIYGFKSIINKYVN